MSAGDLQVEMNLANNNDGITTSLTDTTAGTKTWTVSDVELMLEYVGLNSSSAQMISSQNSGDTPSASIRSQTMLAQWPPGRTPTSRFPPAIIRSRRSLPYSGCKLTLTSPTQKTISARENPITYVGQWYYSIGGKNVPSTPVKSNTEAYAEMSKAIHAFGAVDHTYMIRRGPYRKKTSTA